MNDQYAWGNLFLRLGLGFVFVFTGIAKLFLGLVPAEPIGAILNAIGMGALSTTGFGMFLGILELMVGLMMILGLFTKIVGWVTAIMLLSFIIGVSVILGAGLMQPMFMFKDIGLLAGALCLGFQGAPGISLDAVLWHK